MSEFYCKNNHPMRGPICRECGERVHTMDGYTSEYWDAIEKDSEEKDGRNISETD